MFVIICIISNISVIGRVIVMVVMNMVVVKLVMLVKWLVFS